MKTAIEQVERMKEPGITHHIRLTSDTERASPGADQVADLINLLRERDGQEREGEVHLSDAEAARIRDALASRCASPGAAEAVEAAWQDLIEKDDRTSPEEYPDMALITRGDLAGYMSDAVAPEQPAQASEVERLREALEPFARYADAILKRRDGAQDEPVAVDRLVFGIDGQHVTIGDLRRARAALATHPSTGERA